MTKREIFGDITKISQGIIMHQVNCQNVMGAGVAKSLYQIYPRVKNSIINLLKNIIHQSNGLVCYKLLKFLIS